MAARNWTGKWSGGRTFTDAAGRPRWCLERMVDGRRFTTTLDAKSEEDALAEAALFDRDPLAYRTARQARAQATADALVIEDASVAKVIAHLSKKDRSPAYLDDLTTYLGDWGEDLEGADIRQLTLKDLMKVLNARSTARQKRVAAIKSFTAYYREEEASLTLAQDPTASLKSIPSRPEKLVKEKGYSMERVEKIYRATYRWEDDLGEPDRFGRRKPLGGRSKDGNGSAQRVRDYLRLRAYCGMHHSEIDRLVQGKGEMEPVKHPKIKGTLKFIHKTGRVHHLAVDAQTFAAALRLRAGGVILTESYLSTSIKYAAKKAGVEPINPSELRHSFTNWASESGVEVKPKKTGVSLEAIASVLGHRSSRTSGLFYFGNKNVPAMIALPSLKLFHPEDPRLAKASSSA